MPLWRLGAGAFQRPDGSTAPALYNEARSRVQVDELVCSLSTRLGIDVRWKDEGEVALAAPLSPHAFNGLRAFAAHQDHPVRGFLGRARRFTLDEHPEEHPGIGAVLTGGTSRAPHLVHTTDRNAVLLPCPLPGPAALGDGFTYGSSLSVLAELRTLSRPLGIGPGAAADAGLQPVREAWSTLYRAVQKSLAEGLPVILSDV